MPGVTYNTTTWHVPSTRSNATPTPALAKLRDQYHAYITTLWRYHGHRGRGTTTAGPEGGSTAPGAPDCVIPFSYFQDSFIKKPCPASRIAEHTMQQPGKQKATSNVQVVSIMSIKFVLCIIP